MRCRELVAASAMLLQLSACEPSTPVEARPETQSSGNPNELVNQTAGQVIAAMGQMKVLTDSDASGVHDCAGGGVSIQASGQRTTLTGDCATLTIEGSDNHITAGRLSSLAIRGDGNTVIHEPGITPAISQVGQNNRVQSR
jgi:hypothetical protein